MNPRLGAPDSEALAHRRQVARSRKKTPASGMDRVTTNQHKYGKGICLKISVYECPFVVEEFDMHTVKDVHPATPSFS
jgi:hypothetical protein